LGGLFEQGFFLFLVVLEKNRTCDANKMYFFLNISQCTYTYTYINRKREREVDFFPKKNALAFQKKKEGAILEKNVYKDQAHLYLAIETILSSATSMCIKH